MMLEDLAVRIGARVHTRGRPVRLALDQVYAGDRISDLLNAAGDHSLLVSNIAGEHLLRLVELMEIPGLCLVHGQTPAEGLARAAAEHGTVLMVSPGSLFETCGRIYEVLRAEQPAG